jgi:protein involved in polysaccharide export with SLBB domain
MKYLSVIFAPILFFILASIVQAAGSESLLKQDTGSLQGIGGFSSTEPTYGTTTSSGSLSSSGSTSTPSGFYDGLSVAPLPSPVRDIQQETLDQLVQPQARKESEQFSSRERKVLVKAEPGDGIVSLTWQVAGVRVNPGDPPIRYSISYGAEAGKLDKTIPAGTINHFVIRDLKNSQPYYFIVRGASDDRRIDVASTETRVIPMSKEDQLSPLEKSFARDTVTLRDKIVIDPFKRELKQYGYDFFNSYREMSAATENLPVGGDYVLGPGDSLQVDIWGSMQGRYQLEVDRNGEITIPRVGVVKVWGMGYVQAKETIHKAISRYFKGFELNVTLGQLKTIQVFVVGEVQNPGVYSVSSLATVVNALSVAGGPTKNGSLRSVRLIKGGRVAQDVDLYAVFMVGDRSRDLRLENGDTILVPIIGRTVAVAGEVKRPGIYELKGKMTLPRILALAGGVTALGDISRLQIERIDGNKSRVVLDYEPKGGALEKDLAEVEVKDRDMVKVFPINQALRRIVSLSGNVARPGEFSFKEGFKVRDIITSFDALLPDSYLESAEITRLSGPDMHKEIVTFNLGKALSGDDTANIPLKEQDHIRIFSRWDMQERPMVSVTGEVLKPGTYYYYPNMTVRELVVTAGSLKRNAFMDNAELTRVVVENGKAKTSSVQLNLSKALSGDPVHNLILQADDALIVRGIEDWLESRDRFIVLNGEVKFPGVYSISKGEKLSSLLARAGGFTDKAYLKGAKFTRKSVQKLQQKRMEEVIARSQADILKKQGELATLSASKEELDATKAALEGMMANVEKLKGARAEGRVVIRLSRLDEFRRTPYDIELMGGDTLDIPQISNVINVMGEVYNSTSFILIPDSSVSYYLKKAGGATGNAEEDDMYIVKADGSVFSRHQSSFGMRWDQDDNRWTFGSFMSATMEPSDTLVVPQKIERVAWLRTIKELTTIISQIALTAGTIFIGLK